MKTQPGYSWLSWVALGGYFSFWAWAASPLVVLLVFGRIPSAPVAPAFVAMVAACTALTLLPSALYVVLYRWGLSAQIWPAENYNHQEMNWAHRFNSSRTSQLFLLLAAIIFLLFIVLGGGVSANTYYLSWLCFC